MVLDSLNRWLTLIANVGVLIGIALLILELDQNVTAVKAQTRSELSMGVVQILQDVYADPEFASIIERGDGGGELTPSEQFRYEARSRALLRYWENVHYQYHNGLYDQSEYEAQKHAWKMYFERSTRLADVWCAIQAEYSVRFRAEVSHLIGERGCTSDDAQQTQGLDD